MVVYELCSREERTTCKSDQEISDAIQFSYLVTIENGQVYKHEQYPSVDSDFI